MYFLDIPPLETKPHFVFSDNCFQSLNTQCLNTVASPKTTEKPSACWATGASRDAWGYKRNQEPEAAHGGRCVSSAAVSDSGLHSYRLLPPPRRGAMTAPVRHQSRRPAGRGLSSSVAQFRLPQPRRRLPPRVPARHPPPARRFPSQHPRPAVPLAGASAPPAAAEGAARPAPCPDARPPGGADGGCSWASPPLDYRSQRASGGLCQVASNMASP